MNYKVLYRKYRPQTFDELIGQKTVVELLKDSIINNKISHAYIFSGPRGTGKTSTAKIFAKTINCLNIENGNPCLKCYNCLNFYNSNDIYEIDAASNTGVDQIREIIDNVKLTPINSKYKVYIIDEVHMLSVSAFNALLLTLEEPPSHAIFILATTNIEDVPITVLSRCQRLDFKKIKLAEITEQLKKIASLEKISIDDDAILEIASYSEGGMRDALSMLDQISKINKHITVEDVYNSIGSISEHTIEKMIDDLNNNQIDNVIKFIENAKECAVDYKTLIKKIINVLKKRALDTKLNNRIDRLSYDDYKNLCFSLSDTLYKTNVNVDLFGLLELNIIEYIKISNENKSIDEPKNNKENNNLIVENKLSNNYYKNLEEVRINNCFVTASKENKNKCLQKWNDFVVNCTNKKIKGLIQDTNLVLASENLFVINANITSISAEINQNIKLLESEFNNLNSTNYNIIATSNENWNKQMNKYIKNMQNHIKYNIISEPVEEYASAEICDIFNISKVEER